MWRIMVEAEKALIEHETEAEPGEDMDTKAEI